MSASYTAPNTVGTYYVIATSVADPTKYARATVSVNEAPRYTGWIKVTNTGTDSQDLEINGWINFDVTLVAEDWPTQENSYIIESVVANAELFREWSDGFTVTKFKGWLENVEDTSMFWVSEKNGIELVLDPNEKNYQLHIQEIKVPCYIYYDDGTYGEFDFRLPLKDGAVVTSVYSLKDNPSHLEGTYIEEPMEGEPGLTLTIEWKLDKIL